MLKKSFLIIVSLFCGVGLAKADMYAVSNIHVDVTAQNATIAREQGLNDAQEKAFYKMLDRLTLFKDMEALPVLTSEDILNLVQDFSVSNEKTSSVRYIADVDVQFNPEAIQTFFQEYQVPYVTSAAERSVVFPLYRESPASAPLLWQDTNPWARTLSQVSKKSDLVPFIVPLGDLDDMSVISEDNWTNEDTDITPLLNRYQSASALVIELTVLKNENALKVFIYPFHNKKSDIGEMSLTEPINAPMPEVLRRAAERAVYLLEQAWREKNAVRFDNPTKLSVRVNIQNLAEWIAIRKRLDKIKLIKQYVVKALRKDQAEIEIFYAGQIAPFKDALKKEELFLSQAPEDTWLLRNIKDVPLAELNADNATAQQSPAPIEQEIPVLEDTVSNEGDVVAQTDQQYIPPQENNEQIRTFDPILYQSIEESQPESLQMLEEMKANALPGTSDNQPQPATPATLAPTAPAPSTPVKTQE